MDYFLTDNRTTSNTPKSISPYLVSERAFPPWTKPSFPGGLSGRKRQLSGDLNLRSRTSYLNNIFIMFCKRNNISQHFSLVSDKWTIYKAYPQSLPCEQLAWSLENKTLGYSECLPFLFFSLFSFQNKSFWIGRIFKWQPGPVWGCNISILNKGWFKGLKPFFSFIWLIFPKDLCLIWTYLARFSHWATNPHKPACIVCLMPHWARQ